MTRTPSLPPTAVADLKHLTQSELSMRARLAHVMLALVASAMTVIVTSLWLTEPALPSRTASAFGVLTCMGLGWTAFSVWVLKSRRVMLASHRVVAGRLAVLFTSVFVAGSLVLGMVSGLRPAQPAAVMGAVLLLIAITLWRRAEAAHARLVSRRDALERELSRRTR